MSVTCKMSLVDQVYAYCNSHTEPMSGVVSLRDQPYVIVITVRPYLLPIMGDLHPYPNNLIYCRMLNVGGHLSW